jgi:hypothetical protein
MPQVACEVYCKETCALEVLAVEHSVTDLTLAILANGSITHSPDTSIDCPRGCHSMLTAHCFIPFDC